MRVVNDIFHVVATVLDRVQMYVRVDFVFRAAVPKPTVLSS